MLVSGRSCLSGALASILIAAKVGAATDLVSNSGFESGTFTPWIKSGDGIGSVDTASNMSGLIFAPHSGTYFAKLGNVGPGGGDKLPTYLSQTISGLAPGPYTLSYHYSVIDMPLDGCWLSSSLAGLALANTTIFAGAQGSGYRQITASFTLSSDVASSETLEFAVTCNGWALVVILGLDDVSLVAN